MNLCFSRLTQVEDKYCYRIHCQPVCLLSILGSLMSPSRLPLPTSVMIVEDDAVTRRSLSLAIESEPSVKLVAAFDSVKPALAWLETQAVDILLTDLGLPDGSGIEIILACSRRYPNCASMVITISADAKDVLACIEAG